MASGNPAYLSKVQVFARAMAAGEVNQKGGGVWDCGYKNVFLSEYYLLTGDKEVLPGITALTVKMAKGQGLYGTFGHGFSDLTPDGKLHGSIPPYGPVNQAGLIANLSIVMGKKCGVNDPEVVPAIGRASKFFGYFVDKGAVPYGEHEPWPYHENNGKSALAAELDEQGRIAGLGVSRRSRKNVGKLWRRLTMKKEIKMSAGTRMALNPTRRSFCGAMAAGTIGAAMSPVRAFGQTVSGVTVGGGLVKPTPQQLAWQDLEVGLFIHFDMMTFTGAMKPRIPDDVNRYNPTKLNTDQWMEVAKSMGAKYAVFVAKHCTAFLSWQSNAYPYGVKQTAWRGGKGDVVRDFIASCKKYDIKPGLYASAGYPEWWGSDNPGVNNPALVPWGKKTVKDWNKACGIILTELWTNYGELTEIWFDGGVVPVEQGGPNLVPIMKKHQPKAIVFGSPVPGGIRWGGNEVGLAPYPCWSTIKNFGDNLGGDGDGKLWTPAECDSTLPGHDWFWGGGDPSAKPNEESQQKMLAELMDKYYHSVGHNANLLLNATPDTTGLIPDAILPHYANFGKEIRRRFGTPVAETKGDGDTVELVLKKPAQIDHVMIMEDLAQGERIRAYEVEGLVPGNTWKKLCDGVSVGHKRIQQFQRSEVAKIRLRTTKSIAPPKIRRLAVFNVV